MWKWFKKKPKTTAEQKLEEISNILFPPLELSEKDNIKFHIDSSADNNLDAVLCDLQDGYNDEGTHNTLKNISDRLFKVRQILESYAEFNVEAKYVVLKSDDIKE